MQNDDPAKSYIETVLARADGATAGPWSERHSGDFGMAVREEVLDSDGLPLAESVRGSMQCVIRTPEDQYNSDAVRQGRKDFEFMAASRQDIETLAKIALRAIDVLKFITEESDCDREADDRVKDACWAALADIDALAAKGSQ